MTPTPGMWKDGDGWGNRVGTVPLDAESARRSLAMALEMDGAVAWSEEWRFIADVFVPAVKELK